MILSVPSKTFLLGEYGVLKGASAVLLCTEPRFQLKVQKRSQDKNLKNIFLGSPMGQLYKKHEAELRDYEFEFQDPWKKKGGFGASSAQFALLYYFYKTQVCHNDFSWNKQTLDEFRKVYHQCAWNGQGLAPSGADVVAQTMGQICFVDFPEGKVDIANWNFEKLDFMVFKTPYKVATHKHLESLKEVLWVKIREASMLGFKALQNKDEQVFLNSIQTQRFLLKELDFCAQQTLELYSQLDQIKAIKAFKGCGALGADVIFAAFNKEQLEDVKESCKKLELKPVASSQNLSMGIEVKNEMV